MGKKHFSDNKPNRREPGGSAGRFGNNERGNFESRGVGSRPAGRGENYSPARPSFGQGGSKPGGRPGGKFGGDRGGFGGNRPERNSFGGGERPERGSYGERDRPERGGYAGNRPTQGGYGNQRSFGNDRGGDRDARPRRYEQSEGNSRPPRDERSERPAYSPKPIWQGQPVRYEGKPTVPRGTQGERNRKFIKQNPDEPTAERPAYTGRDERRSFAERGGSRPAGGYDGSARSRPEGSAELRNNERREGNFEGRQQREGGYERRDDRRAGGDQGRSFRREEGDRSERRSFGNREGGERRESSYQGPRKYEGDRGSDRNSRPARPERGTDRPRSYGEQPTGNSGGGTFRERREAMRAQASGPRAGTGYGSRTEQPGQAPDYKNLKHYETDKNRGNKRRRDDEDFGTEELRLNRYIANAGICSRREADALIAAGEIRVNGEVVTEMGYKVQPTDTVQYGKTNLNREKVVYVLLNKPKDFITTTDDPEGRKTVMDLVANASKERIFPVGRLDRNTTGLLLFTNDGEVAQKLSHPSHKNKKIYQAELDKPLTAEHLAEITAGVELEDGKAEVDDVAVVAGNPHFVGVELHIGRNRVVRRIFEHLGYDVVALDRVQYAGLTKKDLPRGKWRFLSEQEVIRLKYFM